MTNVQTIPSISRTNQAWQEVQPYQLKISTELADRAWDKFVVKTSGGHHVQTSLWAQVKASLGWQTVRLTVSKEGEIVAGAQVLQRRLPLIGAVGFVSRGPLLAMADAQLTTLVINELQKVARRYRILFLVVQPPGGDTAVTQALPHLNFQPSERHVAPTATIVIDLSKDLDDILAGMHKKTRYGIRRAQREGINIRQGTANDLDTCYEMLLATAERNRFTAYPKSYYAKMWQLFEPHGYIKMFLAEYKGEVVSAHLVIPFGDTLLSKMAFWSGKYGRLKPNELLEWEVIQWAKAQGYRYYDFEGIKPKVAQIIHRGDPLPDSLRYTAASFKLGFSQQVAFSPGAYEYIYPPFLRWIYHKLYQQISNSRTLENTMKRLRTQ